MLEADFNLDRRLERRQEAGTALVDIHHHRAQHLDRATRHGMGFQADLADQLDEGGGGAVHDRNFRTFDLDDGVIDTEAGQSRHQVFDRGDRHAVIIGDRGAEANLVDVFGPGGDAIVAIADIGADENDTGAGTGRLQHHADPLTGVKTDARENNWGRQCVPVNHDNTPFCLWFTPETVGQTTAVYPCSERQDGSAFN